MQAGATGTGAAERTMATKKAADVSIGKFDILATYTYAKALLDGAGRRRGQGAGHGRGDHGGQGQARPHGRQPTIQADKPAAEKKKKTTITAESFDHQVADKMGEFFEKTFLPGDARSSSRRGCPTTR